MVEYAWQELFKIGMMLTFVLWNFNESYRYSKINVLQESHVVDSSRLLFKVEVDPVVVAVHISFVEFPNEDVLETWRTQNQTVSGVKCKPDLLKSRSKAAVQNFWNKL